MKNTIFKDFQWHMFLASKTQKSKSYKLVKEQYGPFYQKKEKQCKQKIKKGSDCEQHEQLLSKKLMHFDPNGLDEQCEDGMIRLEHNLIERIFNKKENDEEINNQIVIRKLLKEDFKKITQSKLRNTRRRENEKTQHKWRIDDSEQSNMEMTTEISFQIQPRKEQEDQELKELQIEYHRILYDAKIQKLQKCQPNRFSSQDLEDNFSQADYYELAYLNRKIQEFNKL